LAENLKYKQVAVCRLFCEISGIWFFSWAPGSVMRLPRAGNAFKAAIKTGFAEWVRIPRIDMDIA
jgi:hypothetical protein